MKCSFCCVVFMSFVLLLSACVRPLNPSVVVMPSPGKPFDVFVGEDKRCRDFAQNQIQGSPQEIANNNLIEGGGIGTALGAAAGTAVGSLTGHVGAGAVIGAGIGLAQGSAIGSANGSEALWSTQRAYNVAYQQCMYANGNQVEGFPLAYLPYPPPPPPALSPSSVPAKK